MRLFLSIKSSKCVRFRSLLVMMCFCFNGSANDVFYLRCFDTDNLEKIATFSVNSRSKKIEISNVGDGIYRLDNFNKGTEIMISAENYSTEKYKRHDMRSEIAVKYNFEPVLKSGDTIVIELQLKSELLLKRWAEEDKQYPVGDTSTIELNPDTKPNLIDEREFNKKIAMKLHFPKYLVDEGVEGTVYIAAIAEMDGTLTNFSVAKSVDLQLDRIALRAVRSVGLIKINSATKNAVPVRTRLVIPVSFRTTVSPK